MCAFEMCFPNPCAFHGRLFYVEKIMTSCVPPTDIPECIPPSCDVCSASNHNSNLCHHYVQLRDEIENSIKLHLIRWRI